MMPLKLKRPHPLLAALVWVLCINGAHAAAVEAPTALRGLWSQANPEGRKQCLAYKKQRIQEHLVGAILIEPKKITDLAEYGEDDQYELTAVKPLGQQSWQISALVDWYPQGEQPKTSAQLNLSLKKSKLHWTVKHTENGQETKETWVYFRCL